jgi:release factor glutamine methyltransferase
MIRRSDSKPPACDPVENGSATIRSLLLHARRRLAGAGVPSPEADAEALVGHVLGVKRSEIYLDDAREATPRERSAILNLVERRAGRIPLQRLIGECEFMSLPFQVREGVFIPRPETEILTECVVERLRARGTPARNILDIGTGSGVMGISLAVYLRPEMALATDISLIAVEAARSNAILNGVERVVRFLVCDGLDAIRGGRAAVFDVVVCNPPYIRSADIPGLEPEVRDHEPLWALDGGPDGLEFIAGILPRVPSILDEGGVVAFEVGASQGSRVRGLFRKAGLVRTEIVKDLAGLDRVVIGRRS